MFLALLPSVYLHLRLTVGVHVSVSLSLVSSWLRQRVSELQSVCLCWCVFTVRGCLSAFCQGIRVCWWRCFVTLCHVFFFPFSCTFINLRINAAKASRGYVTHRLLMKWNLLTVFIQSLHYWYLQKAFPHGVHLLFFVSSGMNFFFFLRMLRFQIILVWSFSWRFLGFFYSCQDICLELGLLSFLPLANEIY